jgi:hypothetical protein
MCGYSKLGSFFETGTFFEFGGVTHNAIYTLIGADFLNLVFFFDRVYHSYLIMCVFSKLGFFFETNTFFKLGRSADLLNFVFLLDKGVSFIPHYVRLF